MTPKDLLQTAINHLELAGCDTPRLDAEILLAHSVGRNRAWLYAHLTEPLSPESMAHFESLLARRAQREPVAYLTGSRAFYGLDFAVSPAVLVPRPETERLIELSLPHLQNALSQATPPTVVDVGTGSGCIAVTLATHLPQVTVIATDISWPALQVAQKNVRQHQVEARVILLQADLLTGLHLPIDFLIANPPYIAPTELPTLAPEVAQYEPPHALTDNADGLLLIRRLLQQARPRWRLGGRLFIEIGASQGQAVLKMARALYPRSQFEIVTDWAGRDRVLAGWRVG